MFSKKKYSYGKQSISWSDIWSVVKVLKSDWLTQGPKVKEFEQAICDYTGAKYCVAVSNGTAALHLSTLCFDLSKGDEVITSPNTFLSSANSILYSGGKVVFADIDPKTANIDPEQIKKQITSKTKGIIPVHYAGQSCDMKSISKIAKEHNLFVIEDAAHAIGSIYKGHKVGSCKYSDITTFSFHPVKTITTGEGGAITTNNKDLYEKLLMLRSHGVTKDKTRFVIPVAEPGSSFIKKSEFQNHGPWYYEQQLLGFNYRMPDINAALGISQLKRLDKFIKRRREIVDVYKKEFSGDPRFSFLEEKQYSKSAFHLFPLLVNFEEVKINKEQLFLKLREKGLCLQVHYIPVHLQPYYQRFGFKNGDFPITENYYRKTISLPVFFGLKSKDVFYIVQLIKRLVK